MPSAHIRDFRPDDTDRLYTVCLLTGDAGADASELVSRPRLLGDIYVGAYLKFAPEFALVADDGSAAAGYALGVLDTTAFESWAASEWWPAVQARYPSAAEEPERKDLERELLDIVSDPMRASHPEFSGYPSHLHIDLMEHIRGHGIGSTMMTELFSRLRAAGSPGVHLGVDVENRAAQRFYVRLGFQELRRRHDEVFMGLRLATAS